MQIQNGESFRSFMSSWDGFFVTKWDFRHALKQGCQTHSMVGPVTSVCWPRQPGKGSSLLINDHQSSTREEWKPADTRPSVEWVWHRIWVSKITIQDPAPDSTHVRYLQRRVPSTEIINLSCLFLSLCVTDVRVCFVFDDWCAYAPPQQKLGVKIREKWRFSITWIGLVLT